MATYYEPTATEVSRYCGIEQSHSGFGSESKALTAIADYIADGMEEFKHATGMTLTSESVEDEDQKTIRRAIKAYACSMVYRRTASIKNDGGGGLRALSRDEWSVYKSIEQDFRDRSLPASEQDRSENWS